VLFEQVPYLISGGLFGLGLTFCGALTFFSSWLARLVQLQRQQAELTQKLLDRLPDAARTDPGPARLPSQAGWRNDQQTASLSPGDLRPR
jgi:hypothetical protein